MTEADLAFPARAARLSIADWLTVERAAFGAVTFAAVALRLLQLGAHPLAPAEAAQALPAWLAATGRAFDAAGTSPLLFNLQRFTFIPFPAGDAAARFWPALLGGLAVLLFYALRDRLGRGGALAAAALWAFSPLAVFSGRMGLGYGLVPPLALALLAATNLYLGKHRQAEAAVTRSRSTGDDGADADGAIADGADVDRFVSDRDVSGSANPDTPARNGGGPVSGPAGLAESSLVWAAIALGLLLVAGAGAYTVVLIGAIAAVLWRPGRRAIGQGLRRTPKPFALALGLSLVLAATGFLSWPGGLASAADLLAKWVTGFWSGAPSYSVWDLARDLLVSEPLLLGAAIAGLVLALRRHDQFGKLAALAAAIGILVPLISAGRQPGDLGLAVMALVLLAGPAIASVLGAAMAWRRVPDAWMLLVLSLALLVAALINFIDAMNATTPVRDQAIHGVMALIMGFLAIGLWVIFATAGTRELVRRTLPIFALVVGATWGMGQLVGLSEGLRPEQFGGIVSGVPGPGWPLLQRELASLDGVYSTGSRELAIDLWVQPVAQSGPGVAGAAAQDDPLLPMLQWELKDYVNLRLVNGALPAVPAPVMLTPMMPGTPPGTVAGIPEGYSGASFELFRSWQLTGLEGPNAILRWLLYREAGPPAVRWQAVLWINRAAVRTTGSAAAGFAPGALVPAFPAQPAQPGQPQ